ncbi:hypothetical protein BpHYR1_021283 [Brachionus plicatilis]|uniref:Uncharacterized protein n=1 Tax=Brachionus plicatilis TaxID=10195 RepID=A0A3M7PIC1_BRAPC|nr:hypothetical protein BpHYR1_021283 [Brachionus plicatilis]
MTDQLETTITLIRNIKFLIDQNMDENFSCSKSAQNQDIGLNHFHSREYELWKKITLIEEQLKESMARVFSVEYNNLNNLNNLK